MPDVEALRIGMREVADRVGPWESDNIHLAGDVFTMSDGVVGIEVRAAMVFEILAGLVDEDLTGLRVLDLGAAEGLFAVEAARRGAEVVAIEARHPHCERLRFVKDALELERLKVIEGDVRVLDVEQHGQFDVILCLGILYHLPSPDVFHFLAMLRRSCRRLALIETHFALRSSVTIRHGDGSYNGWRYREHDPSTTLAQRAQESRASIDNVESFWPTRSSLYNMVADAGFDGVFEMRIPRGHQLTDRTMLLAFTAPMSSLKSAPQLGPLRWPRWKENEPIRPVTAQRPTGWRVARRFMPDRVVRVVRGQR